MEAGGSLEQECVMFGNITAQLRKPGRGRNFRFQDMDRKPDGSIHQYSRTCTITFSKRKDPGTFKYCDYKPENSLGDPLVFKQM